MAGSGKLKTHLLVIGASPRVKIMKAIKLLNECTLVTGIVTLWWDTALMIEAHEIV